MQISFFFITSLQETLKDFPQFQLQFSHHYLHIYIGATHNLSFSPRIAKMYGRGNHKKENTKVSEGLSTQNVKRRNKQFLSPLIAAHWLKMMYVLVPFCTGTINLIAESLQVPSSGRLMSLRESPPEDHAGKSTVQITDSPETWHTCSTSLVH